MMNSPNPNQVTVGDIGGAFCVRYREMPAEVACDGESGIEIDQTQTHRLIPQITLYSSLALPYIVTFSQEQRHSLA